MKKTNEEFEIILSAHILKPHDNEERLHDLSILLVDAYLDRRDSLKNNDNIEEKNHV